MAGAFAHIGFKVVSPLFVQQGQSRNVSDQACASWVYEVVSRPVAVTLRDEVDDESKMGARMEKEVERLTKLADTFDNTIGLEAGLLVQSSSESFRSLLVLFKASTTTIKAAPSDVQAALDMLAMKPAKDPINLGLKHGRLGKYVMQTAQVLIQKSEKDKLGDKKLDKVFNQLGTFLAKTDLDKPFGDCRGWLAEVHSSLQLWTKVGFERRTADMVKFGCMVGDLLQQWQSHLVTDVKQVFGSVAKELDVVAFPFLDVEVGAASGGAASGSGGDEGRRAIASLPDSLPEAVVDAVQGGSMNEQALVGLQASVDELESFLEVCQTLELKTQEFAKDIDTKIELGIRGPALALLEQVSDLANLVKVLRGCAYALCKGSLEVPYADALRTWSAWSAIAIRGAVASGETVPMLQNLVTATEGAVQLIKSKAWAGQRWDDPHLQDLFVFETGPIGGFLLPMLKAKVATMCRSAMLSVADSLFTSSLGLRSPNEIDALAKSGELKKGLGFLFVGGTSGDGNLLGDRIMKDILELEKSSGSIQNMWGSGEPKWKHKSAMNMARLFLNILRGLLQALGRRSLC